MKSLFKRGLLAAAAVAIPATAILAGPLAAHASVVSPPSSALTYTVNASTLSYYHPDTTNVAGPATVATPSGPEWAFDDLHLNLVGVRDSSDSWSVTIGASGSYFSWANPLTGYGFRGIGAINGWYNVEVVSTHTPNAKLLPKLEPGILTQEDIVNQLFGGGATITGGHYDYTYAGIPGAPGKVYTQVG